ncbi:hypothetical protein ACE1B6_07520 [Aerosakkonemataceae cyanobacterium BLCC-F154]|uniref:DUF8171 domain-containing protein n=1 Tax=Floridaenema fluviatile BLCC-F154 TaxID=3153640 RepID=A0ABV4YAG7_9CYAN
MNSAYNAKLVIVGVLSTVSFFILLTLTEAIPEIPVDIDFKPFFVPMSLIAVVPTGCPALAVSLGAMLGEFLRDMLEGYEIDDPIGAVGYVVGFFSSAYVIGNRPLNKVRVFIACLVAGFVHAVIEATSFIIFDTETLYIAVYAAIGNTITDGLIMGAIPTIFIVPRLYGRIERYLGFPPKGIEHYRRDRRQQARGTALPF